jgi:hypothetical protein
MNVATDPDVQINPQDVFGFEALKKRFDFKSLLADEDAASTDGTAAAPSAAS